MSIIKTDWRNKLCEKKLEYLLFIKVEGRELSKFAETFCLKEVTLWLNNKEWCISQEKRKFKECATKPKHKTFL